MAELFWPSKAGSLIVSAGNWVAPEDSASPEEKAGAVRTQIDQKWAERLRSLDPAWLSPLALERLLQLRDSIDEKFPAGAGFEIIESTVVDPDGFWFFEMGCQAWMARLGQLRRGELFPETPGARAALKIEEIWRANGPSAVAAQLDAVTKNNPETDAVVALYRLPLAIWHERNTELALRLIDHLTSQLDSDVLAQLGATWPLTFGLVHALKGDLSLAERLLDRDKIASRPRGWKGLEGTEATYQRARYLWGQETDASTKIALGLVEEVCFLKSSYMLRLLTDPGFTQANWMEQDNLQRLLNRLSNEASGSWTRWQQTEGASPTDDPRTKKVQEVVKWLGPSNYILAAAAGALPEAGARQTVQFDRAFLATVERIKNFLAGLSDSMTLRLGKGSTRQVAGITDSLLADLTESMKNPDSRTAELVELLGAELPDALRMGLVYYGQMLSEALITTGDTIERELAETPTVEARKRLKETVALLNDCAAQIEPIKKIGRSGQGDQSVLGVGSELLRQIEPVWAAFQKIEERWGRQNSLAFGRLNISKEQPDTEVELAEGGFKAVRVVVTDGTKTPIEGIPVVWKVVSGPARARLLDSRLGERIDISSKSGKALLTVDAGGGKRGGEGHLEARVLGQPNAIKINYRIL